MRRIAMMVAVVVAGLSGAAGAGAVTSTQVTGTVPARPIDAARDGAGVLILTGRLEVSRISGGRVGPAQVITRDRRVRQAHVLASPRGSAVVVWSINGEILASRRPTRHARFGPPRIVSRHPGAATGAAAGLIAASAPDGRVLAAWWGGPAGGRLGIQTAELGAGGTWSAPVDASDGTYPPPTPTVGSSLPIGASFAPGAGGGWIVGWTETTGGPASSSSALATARRGGEDWEPVVRQPIGTLWSAPVILGTGPETVAAWVEGRGRRPDGVVAEVCLVASRTVAGASARRELGCQPSGIGVGAPQLLARTAGGGSMLTWSVPVPQGLGATAFARVPGSDDWSAPSPAVGGARGGTQIEELQTVSGGRTALVAQILSPTTAGNLGRLQIVLLGPDGTVLSRALGPRTPGKPRTFSTTYRPLGSAAPHGVLSWPLATGRYRVSLIDLAGQPAQT